MYIFQNMRRLQLIVGCFIVFMLTGSGIGMANTVNGVWMYGFEDGFDNAEEVGYLSDMGINQIYLSMGIAENHKLIDQGSGSYDGTYTAGLSDFITRSNNAGISVHAMTLEDPVFTYTDNHAAGFGLVDNILSYNTSNSGAAFDGIHINVDPWTLGDWDPVDWVYNNNLLGQYIDLTSGISDQITTHSQPLEFSATIAWWFNEEANNGILTNGYTTTLTENVDVLVPLVYDGVGGSWLDIVDRAGDEISEAPTLIGIGAHEFTSYSDVINAQTGLDAAFSGNSNYMGTSVFKYDSLKTQYLTSVAPEPISSILFLTGGATLGLRRYVRRRNNKNLQST